MANVNLVDSNDIEVLQNNSNIGLKLVDRLDMINDTSGANWQDMMKNKLDYCIANINTTKTNIETFINGGWSGVNYGFGVFSKLGNVYQLVWYSNDGIYYCRKLGNNYDYTNIIGQKNYSTTETVIGTWIDGKPLYRRVIVKDNVGTSCNAGYAYAYIDTLTKMQFIAVTPYDSAGVGIIDGNFNDGTNKVKLQAYKVSDDIDIWFDSTVSCTKLIITLEYTKTTN